MVSEEEFKRALGHFATGVTIVTVGVEGRLHGMTASAFASVSLKPPLVLVCLDKRSETRALLLATGSFAVNVLSADQEGIARAFARSGDKPFDEWGYSFGSEGHPLLRGAIASIECRTHNVVEGGDHDVVIAEVVACGESEAAPLVYYDGTYRTLKDL